MRFLSLNRGSECDTMALSPLGLELCGQSASIRERGKT